MILSLGRKTLLVKADIKEAYRMVPIHPQDQQLLGVQWRGEIFIDRMLPFGLHSALKIFSVVADALLTVTVDTVNQGNNPYPSLPG